MDRARAQRILDMRERRDDVERITGDLRAAAAACLGRAAERIAAAQVLFDAEHWDSAFTTAYDAYRMGAEAITLSFGYRVRAVPGAHSITFDIAHAALGGVADAFIPSAADQFRTGRHEAEYFDPDRPVDKT